MVFVTLFIIPLICIIKRILSNRKKAKQIEKHLEYSKQLADTAIELQDASYFDYAEEELKKAEKIIYSHQQKR